MIEAYFRATTHGGNPASHFILRPCACPDVFRYPDGLKRWQQIELKSWLRVRPRSDHIGAPCLAQIPNKVSPHSRQFRQPAGRPSSLGRFVWYNLNNGVVTTSRFAFACGGQILGLLPTVHTIHFSRNSDISGGKYGHKRRNGQYEKTVKSAICAKRLKLQRGRSSVG